MTALSYEARVGTVQVPTVTGIDSLNFPGLNFEYRHLKVEVRHRKLSINPGHWLPSILAANSLANSVTPDPSLGSVPACSASRTAAGQTATPNHGSFLNLFATCLFENQNFHRTWNSVTSTLVFLLIQKESVTFWGFRGKEYHKPQCM